ncbi:hypothetical protein Uis1B_1657 [Bifidobacterium margollesii]|uniref:Uncharacterized protein n=1 Tax=Bifidobacterium margollesii TaxID=2020964 RepID=A0A2N5J8G6_9BIFI|nr:hypothetical protein [Bifidobacterium margollesii]PLS30512.1 hypothetical protein Uis1B_1657 [Bifidobacterium margollesii]
MASSELVEEVAKAQTVQDVLAALKNAGEELTFEQADKLFGKVLQAKSDTAELDGDTIAGAIDEALAK